MIEELLRGIIFSLIWVGIVIAIVNMGETKVVVKNLDNNWKYEMFKLIYKMFTTKKDNREINVVEALLSLNETGKEIANAIRNHTVYLSTTGRKDQ